MKKILLFIVLLSPTNSFALDPLPAPCAVKYYKDLENIRNIREWHPFCTVMTEGPKLYRYHNGRWMDARKVRKLLSKEENLDRFKNYPR